MRFLCLHGRGTSGKIFESQTSSFRKNLTSDIEFDFVDAPIPTVAAPGVAAFYEGPYYSFYDTYDDLPKAHEWLLKQDLGKYDGVMCFSQGCTLIHSFLLYHPDKPSPFKVAVFICGGMPLSVLEKLDVKVAQEEHERTAQAMKDLHHAATAAERGIVRVATPVPIVNEVKEGIDVDAWVAQGGKRIGIPTVHVFGAKDPIRRGGITLSRMCDGGLGGMRKRTFDHGGGHMIPRGKEVSETIAGLVEWAVTMAGGEKILEPAIPQEVSA